MGDILLLRDSAFLFEEYPYSSSLGSTQYIPSPSGFPEPQKTGKGQSHLLLPKI